MKPIRIGISEKNRDPYWDILNKGFQDAAQRLGIELVIMAPEKEDVLLQKEQASQLIHSGVDALALVASDKVEFNPIISEAVALGLPVVCFDLDAESSRRHLYVGTLLFDELGRIAGQKMASLLGPKKTVAIQIGSDKAPGSCGKRDGFIEVMQENDIEVLTVVNDAHDADKAFRNAVQILESFPQLDGLYGVYGYHPGAQVRAIQKLGIDRKIPIVGFDILPETIMGLKNGMVDATIWIREYYFAYMACTMLFDMIKVGVAETLMLFGFTKESNRENVIRLASATITPASLVEYEGLFASLGLS